MMDGWTSKPVHCFVVIDPFPGIGSDNKKQKFTLDFLSESDQKGTMNRLTL